MGTSCELYAHTINSKGEVVESKLFKDLLHYTSDRGLAKEFYAVGINDKFLEQVRNKATFDENGEITFQSLKKFTELDLGKEKELQTLNKDIGAGIYSYQDAMLKLQNFNRSNPFNDKYIATVKQTDGGKYDLFITDRNASNKTALNEIVGNRNLMERIKYFLNQAGADYTFLEEGERGNGRYSTKNASQTADGLYNLIKVANNGKIEESLAEEAGHFAVGALGKSPLVTRLMELLTPEVQREALGEDYDEKVLGDNTRREVAGALVGRAIAGHIDKRAPWQSLVRRIVDTAKRVFYTIVADDVARAKIASTKLAEEIAKGFMSPDFQGNVEAALETKETLYSAKDSFNVKKFKQVSNRLKLQAAEMKNISGDLFDKFNAIALQVESKLTAVDAGIFSDLMALEGIAEALDLMSDLMTSEIPSILESVDFDNTADFSANMVRNAKALRMVRTFAQNALALRDIVNGSTPAINEAIKLTGNVNKIEIVDKEGDKKVLDLYELVKNLDDSLTGRDGLITILSNKESEYFLKFLENSYGGKNVERAARILFQNKKGKPLIDFKEGESVSIKDMMESLDSDITIFERFLASASNSSDIITQIADKTTKLANKWADDLTNRVQEELLLMQKELKKLGYSSTEIFAEKSSRTGELTGNFVSKYVWGDYETDWIEFKTQAKEEFKKQYPNLDEMSDMEAGVAWQGFFQKKAKVWHKGDTLNKPHSQWSAAEQRYIPSEDYLSEQYIKDIKDTPLEGWLNKMMEIKQSLDSRLPEGSTNIYRMPQFKGTFMNRMRNRQMLDNAGQSFIGTLRARITETFLEDSEDTEFGSDQTYNTLDEDIFSDRLSFEREKLNRLPVFGINKLKNTSELSTDLFHSMFAYAGMANTHAAMSQIVDTMEVGKEVLLSRAVGGMKADREKSNEDKSNAFKRYTKFLDKQVYGIGVKKIKIGKRFVLNKLANFFTGLAAKVFLGGNVAGGIVNLGTGTLEILKEALAGEHYNTKDIINAHKTYFENLPENMWDGLTGVLIQTNKVALMQRHFNMLGKSKENQRSWNTNQWRATRANPFGENLFLPYKAGEHYMQTIPYLAIASRTKIYNSDGNRISLLNAYKVVDLGDGVKTLVLTENPEKFVALSQLKKKIDSAIRSNTHPADVEFTEQEEQYLGNLPIDLISISERLDNDIKRLNTFFKNNKSKDTYDMLNSIYEKINAPTTAGPFSSAIKLTKEEQNYIDTQGYNLADTENVSAKLQEEMTNLTWTIDDESDFMNKAREISNRMHGIYNNQDKVAFQQGLFGNMLLAMKGYALGLMERRFSQSKYSVALGQESEGSLVTAAKVIMSTFTDKGGFGLTARAMFLPFGKNTKQQMLNYGFSVNQYYNMRRNFGDYMFLAALVILRMLTAKPEGGDDDDLLEENNITGIAHYFTYRLLREQAAYGAPMYMMDEIQNLTNMAPTGISVLSSLQDLAFMAGGAAIVKNKEDARFYYQSSKSGIYEKGDPKWENKAKRMFPYLRSGYTFEHPYDAAAAFEYGRRLRTR